MALPGNDLDLSTAYSSQDYIDVSADDGTRVSQISGVGEYAIHQFKEYAGANNSCTVLWNGQTSDPPVNSTVYLQIYNQVTTIWNTIDSDNLTDPDIDFDLTTNVPDLTNYKDASDVVSFRVYQLDV